jgi:hypothetical protein
MASRSSFHDLGIGGSSTLAAEDSPALQGKFRRHLGVESTKEFLADIGGRRTKWPLLIAISLIAVCLLGYSASKMLFERAQSSSTSNEHIGTGSITTDAETSEGTAQGVELESMLQRPTDAEKQKKAFAFSLQSKAEAAVEDDLLLESANQRTSDIATNSSINSQVHEVLKAASDAVKNENLDSFLGLLDESEESFFRQQKIKAKVAFRQFDKIDGQYSDVRIKVLDDDKLAVDLHCKVDAAFAKNGRSIVLFNGEQNITLRRAAGAVWKICGID